MPKSKIYEGLIGEDTEVEIMYDFYKEQKAILHAPAERCQEHLPAAVEITAVMISNDDILEDLSQKWIEKWEQVILNWEGRK